MAVKKPKRNREKWEETISLPYPEDSGYWKWLRSASRRIWNKHPVKLSYKQKRRYKAPVGIGGRDVLVSDCEMCGKQCRETEVDHIHGCGSFDNWSSYTRWLKSLINVTHNEIRELCHECHQAVTYSERYNITLHEAKIRLAIIAAVKCGGSKWLMEKGVVPESNATKRKQQISDYIRAEHKLEDGK